MVQKLQKSLKTKSEHSLIIKLTELKYGKMASKVLDFKRLRDNTV
jgi:hypothetical protein